jgi:hypothetical protein
MSYLDTEEPYSPRFREPLQLSLASAPTTGGTRYEPSRWAFHRCLVVWRAHRGVILVLADQTRSISTHKY